MASLNRVMIIGNVGRDAEMRYTPNGVPTTRFSVAANRRWTGADGQLHEETEWFNVVTWNKLAERCSEMITKGMQVYVEGRLQTREWEGQDGQKRRTTDVIANHVLLLGSRGRPAPEAEDAFDEIGRPTPIRPQPARAAGSNGGLGDETEVPADDLPF